MHINALLQPHLTGELIKFGFHNTTVTFRSLNPVLTLLACVNNNDAGESQHHRNPSTQPAKWRCVLAFFTRDNETENNWGKYTRMHGNEPENTNYKSTAGSSQPSRKQENTDNVMNMIQINTKYQTKRQEFIKKTLKDQWSRLQTICGEAEVI